LLWDGKFHLDQPIPELNATLGEELLKVHRSYLSVIQDVLSAVPVKGMAHITGSGLEGNVKRVIPKGMKASIDWSAWQVPSIFSFIQKQGNIASDEMRRVFNMGIGFVVGCTPNNVTQLQTIAKSKGEIPMVIGEIVGGTTD
jgi:phosphoribosylformylglycinamidine cyclo-ligase